MHRAQATLLGLLMVMLQGIGCTVSLRERQLSTGPRGVGSSSFHLRRRTILSLPRRSAPRWLEDHYQPGSRADRRENPLRQILYPNAGLETAESLVRAQVFHS